MLPSHVLVFSKEKNCYKALQYEAVDCAVVQCRHRVCFRFQVLSKMESVCIAFEEKKVVMSVLTLLVLKGSW